MAETFEGLIAAVARWLAHLATIGAAVLALPGAAHAQLRAEPQVAILSRYLWRGITRTDKQSLQSGGGLSVRLGGFALAVGGVSNLELSDGDPGDRTEVGVGMHGLGELDLWSSASVYDGATAISVGVIRYTFHGHSELGGLGPDFNTTELWTSLDLRGEPFAPRVDFFLDISRVKGLYTSASAGTPVLAWPFPPYSKLYVEGELGVNISQDIHPRQPRSGNFDDTGITHARLTFRLPVFQRRGFTGSLAYGAQIGFDAATRTGVDGNPSRGRLAHIVELRLAAPFGGGPQ